MEVEDPATGKTYWYNTKTQKTSFEDPKGAPAAAASASDSSETKSERPKISKMGGQLDSYKDINKGFSLYRPSGWNQFDAAPGEYDIKWEVGASLAAKKKAELVEAKERTTDGVLYYSFQFKAGDQKTGFRELYELCVNKGKLWSLTATTSEKRWAKRQELYNNIMLSFQPRL